MNAQRSGSAARSRQHSAKSLNRKAQGQEPHQHKGSQAGGNSGARNIRRIPRNADARRVAYEALIRIDEQQSFSNLLVPKLCAQAELTHHDAAVVTDMVYGILRWRGLVRPIIAAAAKRHVDDIDATILPILELGVYQALWMQTPEHAVVASTVELAKKLYGKGRAGFVNACMHKVVGKPLQAWQSMIISRIDKADPYERLAVRFSHPKWIVEAFAKAWDQAGYDDGSVTVDSSTPNGSKTTDDGTAQNAAGTTDNALALMLEEDNQPAHVTLARRGDAISQEALMAQLPKHAKVQEGLLSPYALRVQGVNPSQLPALQQGLVGVEDEGSQCAALALAFAPVQGQALALEQATANGKAASDSATSSGAAVSDSAAANDGNGEGSSPSGVRAHWLDMCAGPGGKTALIASRAFQQHIVVSANEPSAHRAGLVRENIAGLPQGAVDTVYEYDGRYFGEHMREQFTRVLVDAPCSGLGSLRRRPEARWRKRPEDITDLVRIQAQLLRSGIDATMSGGVIAYVTCSPAVEETVDIIRELLADKQYGQQVEHLDTTAVLRKACKPMPLPARAGDVTLFEHLHHTDQMFISLLLKR